MGMKHYPAEFKADAVALYRSRPGATIKSDAGTPASASGPPIAYENDFQPAAIALTQAA
ncbi:hypothetical protein GCM10020254_83770 [Streptomyces goshikiensis]